MIRVFISFSLILIVFNVKAQELEGTLSLHSFIDNREFAQSDRFSQTIFGTRFSPEVGILIDSTHRIRLGFNALNEFGSQSKSFFSEMKPVIYYQYDRKEWDFFIGSFPRVQLLDDYPLALLNDTLQYYRPNVEGMLVKYETKNLKQTIWIDWTSKQTDIDRETFLFGLSGRYKMNNFFVSHYAYMYHNVGAKLHKPGDFIQDNGVVLVQLGLNLPTALDSLVLTAGGMMSLERIRNIGGWNKPKGFMGGVYAQFKKFSLNNTLYIGEGHNLIYGDSFYTAKSYNRLDLGWTPILFKNIEGKFTFTFHFVENVIDNQQAFSLRYLIGKKKNIQKKNTY